MQAFLEGAREADAGALMGGKYTVEGDFGLLMRFSQLFSAR